MSLLSPHPAKAAVERYWLLTTPLWSGITGLCMVTGWAETWGDVGCMTYGLLMLAIAWYGPLTLRGAGESSLPVWQTTAFKAGLSVTLLAFGLNYTQTPFFFDVLHMHYGFGATWTIAHNPFFLYLVSVAYFGTYFALCNVSFRWLRRAMPSAGAASWLLAPMAMAFLETALNANPFTTRLFCYDDLPFMLWFGTLSYGAAFVFALPVWIGMDEAPDRPRTPTLHVAVGILAACYADLIVLDVLRYHVAPAFTEVEDRAMNLRDYGDGCLVSPAL